MIISRLSILLLVLVAGGCFGGAAGPELPLVAAQVQDLRDKGHRALSRGDVARAGRLFDDARRLAESIDDRPGLAGALNDLGTNAGFRGDPGKAAEFHRQAHWIALELGDRALIAESLSYRGQAAHLMSDDAAALAFYTQALALVREVNDRRGEAAVLNNLGLLQQAKGEADQAEQSIQRALALNSELGERRANREGVESVLAELTAAYARLLEGVVEEPPPGPVGRWLTDLFNDRPWLTDPNWDHPPPRADAPRH